MMGKGSKKDLSVPVKTVPPGTDHPGPGEERASGHLFGGIIKNQAITVDQAIRLE